ncbi:TrbC/VirB2 family protein [Wolinella succinogenes]|uniref:TrbC/VirB2 family protein n=1 Tax=Wolinella succinogenes TaxID=844 RepID=UPI002FC9D9C0
MRSNHSLPLLSTRLKGSTIGEISTPSPISSTALPTHQNKGKQMKQIVWLWLLSLSLLAASGDPGAKFAEIVERVYDMIQNGVVAGVASLVIIIMGFMLMFKMFEQFKWWFVGIIGGIALLYGGTFIVNAIVN